MLDPTQSYSTANALATRTPSYCVEISPGYREEVLKDSPSLYLPLDESTGSTAEDDSGNSLDGTYVASPTLGVRGPFVNDRATAVRLNGSSQYVSVADDATLDPADTQSGEAWIRPLVISGTQNIYGKGSGSLDFYVKSTGTIAISKNGTAEIVESTVAVSALVWTHVAYTKTGSTVHLYINGADVTSTVTNQTIVATASAVGVGAVSGGGSYFGGALCRVAIYATALSAARIQAHYNSAKGLGAFTMLGKRYGTHHLFDYFEEVLADNPSLYLRLGEASGTTAADSSGNGLDGTLTNTPTLAVTGALSGDENTAMTFTAASSEYATVADNALLDPADTFTLECWANFATVAAGVGGLIDKGVGGYYLYRSAAAMVLAKNGTAIIVTSTNTFVVSTWYHIVATKSGSTVNLYVNGVNVTGSVSNQTIAATATDLNIGRKSDATEYLSASLDELAIYPTALSASRILAHYDAGLGLRNLPNLNRCMAMPRGVAAQVIPDKGQSSTSSITLPLVDSSIYDAEVLADSPALYLPLNEKSGVAVTDYSGNCLHGTLVATPILGNVGPLVGGSDTCLTLNGITQYATIADNALLDPGDTFTLEIWVKLTALPSAGNFYDLIEKGANGYRIVVDENGTVYLQKSGVANICYSLNALSAGVWGHIASTKSGAAFHNYINGRESTTTIGNQTIAATATALNIGRNSSGANYLSGSVARPALYPTALSAERIKAHYISGAFNVGSRGAITRMVYERLNNRQATFRAGFSTVCYSDFASFQRGIIESAKLGGDMLTYSVVLRDPSTLTNKTIFNGAASRLVVALTSGATTAVVQDVSGYQDSGYLRSEDELMTYTGRNTSGTPPPGGSGTTWGSLVYGTDRFVSPLAQTGSTDPVAIWSLNGKDWYSTIATSNSGVIYDVAFAPTLGVSGRYCGVGGGGGNTTMYSDDGGETWTSQTTAGNGLKAVVWAPELNSGNGFFVAVGDSCAYTSDDGFTWTSRTITAATIFEGIAWEASETMLVAVARTGANRVATSPDGITWTPVAASEANDWYSVAWTDISGGRWVAVAITGTHRVMYSDDSGATWTNATSSEQNLWLDVVQTPTGTVLAVAGSGTNRVMSSTDCITWSPVLSAEQKPYYAIAHDGVSRIVATGQSEFGDTAGTAMYSDDDGVTWTASRSGLTGLTRGVDITGWSTTAAAHAVGASVKEVFHITAAHIVDILEDVLTNTDKTGCSVDPALINSTANAAVKTALGSTYTAEFLVEEAISAKEWIETEGCLPFGLYSGVGEKWQLVRIAADAATATTINDDDIVVENGTQRLEWDQNYSSIINKVTVLYDWSPSTNSHETSKTFERADSIVANGPRPLVIQSKGLLTLLPGTTEFVEAIAERILDRYENGAPTARAGVLLHKNLLEPGDLIELTASAVPDTATGVRGVTSQDNEVTSRAMDFPSGIVDLELMKV